MQNCVWIVWKDTKKLGIITNLSVIHKFSEKETDCIGLEEADRPYNMKYLVGIGISG